MTRHVENPYFDPCYWDNEKNLVKTNYLDSRFVFIPNADNLYDELHNTLQSFPEKKHAKLSMDEPNTNWKFLDCYLVTEMKKSGQIY